MSGGAVEAPLGRRGRIASVNVSERKGTAKTPVPRATVVAGRGILGDAHEGFERRQVSLLTIEAIEEQRRKARERAAAGEVSAAEVESVIAPGAYAENLTTRGIDLDVLRVGDELVLGGGVRLRVSQIGKACHTGCAIARLAGECIMPVRGIFCEVLAGGPVAAGDTIEHVAAAR